MSTRCWISVKQKENDKEIVKAVYCQHDGYPEYVGKLLLKKYNSLKKAVALTNTNGFSSLGVTLETTKMSEYDEDESMAYKFDSVEEMIDNRAFDIEFTYLYDNVTNSWLIYNDWTHCFKKLSEESRVKNSHFNFD